ncbi:MAG: DUF1593 domain-containing protein [Planctomycetes bacterium]|nr:DUF1593 domain-containing protein [Planctomycetota bacterium]
MIQHSPCLFCRAWIDTHVRTGHGPLGALCPPKTWTAPNPHAALKEGDTPSWFYFLPNGLGDPEHPEWGGWGGRFAHAAGGLYRDAADEVDGRRTTSKPPAPPGDDRPAPSIPTRCVGLV